jgi:uncharacterized protein (DUF1501 family)
MVTRRDFVKSGLVAAGAGIIVPPIFAKSVFAANADGNQNNRVLVILQLGGGNDGLNTVVPFADPAYGNARPSIGIKGDQALRINNSVGLHPNLTGIKALYDQGQVAIVQGVGYANPTYSHFEGLYVWEHADPTRAQTDGWLGKMLATQYDTNGHPLTGCALGEAGAPSELTAPQVQVSVIDSIATYGVQGGQGRTIAAPALYRKTPGIYGALFDKSMSTAEEGISALAQTGSKYKPMADYGTTTAVYGSKNDLATALQLTAELIVTQPTVKVCHVVLGGFDTHQQEDTRQAALLKDVDIAVSAFMKDLAAQKMADRVVLATWSEFGRRVAENGSNGTDHGSAAPMFVIGAPVKGGLLGEQPSLTSLVEGGNLKYTVDFRSVYQSLIRDWLQADSSSVLGATFPNVTLV